MNKKILLIPLLALLLTGCKGNTWSGDISSPEKSSEVEPDPMEIFISPREFVVGQEATLSVVGDFDQSNLEFSYDNQDLELSFSSTSNAKRYKVYAGGTKGGEVEITAKCGNQVDTVNVRIHGQKPDMFEEISNYGYMYEGQEVPDFDGNLINDANFYLMSSSINGKSTIKGELYLNSVAYHYYLKYYDENQKGFYLLPSEKDNNEKELFVEHLKDDKGRPYVQISFDGKILTLGDSNWSTPIIDFVNFSFDDDGDRGLVEIGQRYRFSMEVATSNEHGNDFNPDMFGYSINKPDGVSVYVTESKTSLEVCVNDSVLNGKRVVLEFHFTYYGDEYDQSFAFYAYNPEDPVMVDYLKQQFAAAYCSTSYNQYQFEGYAMYFFYDEEHNKICFETRGFIDDNFSTLAFREWETTSIQMEYQVDKFVYSFILGSYPGNAVSAYFEGSRIVIEFYFLQYYASVTNYIAGSEYIDFDIMDVTNDVPEIIWIEG